MGFMDWVHGTLDVAGMVPVIGEVADGVNAGLYAAQGDYLNAGISLAGMWPAGGQAVTGTRLAVKAGTGIAEQVGKQTAKEVGQEALERASKEAAEKAAKEGAEEGGEIAAKEVGTKVTKSPAQGSASADQLKKNKAQGKKREAEVKNELEAEGHEVLGSEVTIKTPESNRRVDHLIRDGKTGEIRAIEVKSGNATRSTSQIAKDNAMQGQGGTIIGKNAPDSLQGQTIKIPTEVRN